MDHPAEYLGQIYFRSKVIIRTLTQTHSGLIALPGPIE